MTRWETAAVAVAAAMVGAGVALAGSSSYASGDRGPDMSVCVQALDEADHGFRAFAAQIRTVQQALDDAFNGNLTRANAMLFGMERVSPDRYKQLEAECRDAVRTQ